MQLDIGSFSVNEIVFGGETRLDEDVLKVSRTELRQLVGEDLRIADVEVDFVKPGESARVVHVCDAIEPRIKVSGPGGCYPGVVAPVATVGKGVTHRLRGMSVVISAEYPRLLETGTGAAQEAILEMTGPGALGPLSQLINLVISIKLASGHSLAEYHQAVRMAGFKVAEHLGQTTKERSPTEIDRYELSPVKPGLPRVVHIHQSLTQLNLPVPFITWYGSYVTDWMPLWAHPNEILDGALLPGAQGGHAVKPTSWEHVNNPVIEHLYKAHGKDLDFAGVIFHRTRFEVFEEKQLSANQAAKLAKLMGAQGAIITWIGAGNAFIEAMLTVQALEREGIKAVLMTYEHGGKEGLEAPLIYTVPEADAVVSVGSLDRPIILPRVDRVVGGHDLNIKPEAGDERIPAAEEIKLDWYLPVLSAVDHWGFGKQTCVEY
ncbi:MAG TPA: glycine/sarcosine/betaine reductase component B subunit [Pyrinomonadaceae bacterium]|nr:glycine/sarcosine/betaine reductase component B subunit [Pyrinomonadaceae bacterium]